MGKLIYTNSRGQTVEMYSAPYQLIKVEGLGDVEAEIQTQKAPGQDGSTFIESILEERHISIELKIRGKDAADLVQKKQYFSSVFNPKIGLGLLQHTDATGETREVFAVAESVPSFPRGAENSGVNFQKSLLFLRCPNPYWLTEEQVDQLVVWEGGLEFPLQLPTFFAQQSADKAKILLNEGDAETPIFVTFNGPATAPIKVINKTTGDFIEVNQSLLAGEKLEINTAFGQKRVTKVLTDGTKQNAFHFITLESKFFQLILGNNLIDYSTGADYERAGVTINWRHRYLAV